MNDQSTGNTAQPPKRKTSTGKKPPPRQSKASASNTKTQSQIGPPQYGYWFDGFLVTVDAEGRCLGKRLNYEQSDGVLRKVQPHHSLLERADGNRSGGVIVKADELYAITLIVGDDRLTLGQNEPVMFHQICNYTMSDVDASFSALRITWVQDDGEYYSFEFIAPHEMCFDVWKTCDVRQTELGVAAARVSDLYRVFNETKRHSYLFVMFSDILLLNRQLDAGIPMETLLKEMDGKGAIEFAEDKELREATVNKVMMFTLALPKIKQKFELLAAMYPYYWAQEEVKWISDAFGNSMAASMATKERKRIVPHVRRNVRSTQANIQRALAEIESAVRPLDAILSREEIAKHWSSKMRRWTPIAVQGGLAVTMLLVPGSNAMGAKMLAGMIGTHAAGAVLGTFQKDKEAAGQVKRAAAAIFPWWKVFMRTLAVSMYESGQFVDEERTFAMKRDRQICDSLPEAERPEALNRLSELMRERILREKQNQFVEILEGSNIRLTNLVQDIQMTIGPGMNDYVRDFTQSLSVADERA
ncbi:MAG: hypothetical protein QGI29_01540 [Pirellulales bacterium]|nr:hypothetical protein [Pirellulales bacterium]